MFVHFYLQAINAQYRGISRRASAWNMEQSWITVHVVTAEWVAFPHTPARKEGDREKGVVEKSRSVFSVGKSVVAREVGLKALFQWRLQRIF